MTYLPTAPTWWSATSRRWPDDQAEQQAGREPNTVTGQDQPCAFAADRAGDLYRTGSCSP
jgi:hypothetical protein